MAGWFGGLDGPQREVRTPGEGLSNAGPDRCFSG